VRRAGVLFLSLAAVAVLATAGATRALRAQDDREAKDELKEPTTDLWEEPGQCGACHVEAGWSKLKEPEEFDHASTGFPLRGAHAETKCERCHRRGLTALTQSCNGCHADPHAGLNSKNCEQCHTEVDWKVPRNFFDHERTRFPLTGVHAAIACEACHRNMRAEAPATAPTECIVCHADDYRAAVVRTNGVWDHQNGAFGPGCPTCHINVVPPITWNEATFGGSGTVFR
jgi:hypothetical protein